MSKALATKNVAAVLLALTMAFGFAFAFAAPAKADTTSDLQAQVSALLAQIQALQGNTSSNAACVNFTFTSNLAKGKTSAEVMQIQKFLNQWADTTVSTSGSGSKGNETSYFGAATKAAVIKFQNKYAADILTPNGLSAGNGNWYGSTRAKANGITATCVPGSTGGTTGGNTGGTTTGGNLVVTASTQPANSLAPQGASRVPFTSFTLTNTSNAAVTVNGVTVQRTGLAQDAVFAGVVLVDSNGMQIGTSRTFDSNHMATIGDTFTIGAGQSMTFTVAGNMNASLSAYAGQVVGIAVTGISTTGTVSGSLPISGAQQTINATLAIGTATLYVSSFDPQSAQTKNIGDTAVKFAGVRVTAGSAEDVKLFSIRFRLNGSAGPSDISNVQTMVNGVAYPTTISADGRYYSVVIPGGLLITKGNSADAYIQADITGTNAAGRTIELDIDRSSDIYIVGQTYGYGITGTAASAGAVSSSASHASSFTTGQPFFQGVIVTVSGASVTTIARATEVPAQNVAVNVPGQTLGGFVADIKGEALRVTTMTFNISGVATTTTNQLTNITLVGDNGSVIAGPVDAVGNVVTFNNSITLGTGRHIYTLKGTIPTAAANGGTFTLNTTPSSWTGVTGSNTGNTVTITNGNFTLNTVTVRAATLNITAATSPAAQTIVAGGQNVLLANIQLDASQSGEDIRMNSLPVNFSNVTGATSCQLFNGSTAINSGSNIVNPAGTGISTFNFDNSLVIAKGTVITLAVKCNLSSSASGNYTTGVITSGTQTYAATGVQSGSSLTNNSNLTASTGNSGTQSVGNSTLVVSTDTSSPSYALVAGGSTGVTVGALRIRATGEDMSLTELGLSGSSLIASDVVSARIYNGATQVGSVTFTSAGTVATSTLSTPVTLAKDTDVVLTIKADLALVGTSQSGTAGDVVTINYSGAKATGMNSGSTIYSTGSSSVAGVRLEKTYPTVALIAPSSTSISSGKLMRFSITANAGGPVGVNQLTFQFATSTGLSYTNLNVNVYTTSGFSGTPNDAPNNLFNASPISGTSTASNIKFVASNTTSGSIQIPIGATYYFELTGSVTGAVSGSAITTTLLGDTAYVRGATSTLDAARNFVWSPNSTTTSSFLSADFTTGYGVPGLPASSLAQTLTQ